MSHTPGPWTISDNNEHGDAYIHQAVMPLTRIAIVTQDIFGALPVSANANLIAAAPDLLAACEMIASFAVSWQFLTPGDIREVTSAIAKARGES